MADSKKPAVIAPLDLSKPSSARDLLITATQAYKLYPGNCSGAVNWVIINMVDPKMPPLLANDLMSYFAKPVNGWRQVADATEASELANRGVVVVAGKADPGKHGHVVIVLPGTWKPAGGFFWQTVRCCTNMDHTRPQCRPLGLHPVRRRGQAPSAMATRRSATHGQHRTGSK